MIKEVIGNRTGGKAGGVGDTGVGSSGGGVISGEISKSAGIVAYSTTNIGVRPHRRTNPRQ